MELYELAGEKSIEERKIERGDKKMRKRRSIPKTKEAKRREQIDFIMKHWDELPEELRGRIEGTIQTARDFMQMSKETG